MTKYPKAPLFIEEDGEAKISFNDEIIDREWYRKCRDSLTLFLELIPDEDIELINNKDI